MDKLAIEIRQLLINWLQNTDDLIFTDDIAINEITDEIIDKFKFHYEAKIKEELIKFNVWGFGSEINNKAIIDDVDEYLKQRENG